MSVLLAGNTLSGLGKPGIKKIVYCAVYRISWHEITKCSQRTDLKTQ